MNDNLINYGDKVIYMSEYEQLCKMWPNEIYCYSCGDYDTIMCIYEGSCLCCSISLKRCSKINQILE